MSTAVLTYFVYPLLTGIAAAATGLERLRWQGIACALAAFGGLAIIRVTLGATNSANLTTKVRHSVTFGSVTSW